MEPLQAVRVSRTAAIGIAAVLWLCFAPPVLGAERIFWAGGSVIDFAGLDNTGGGQLSTAGAPPTGAEAVALDPAAGKIYWTNSDGTVAFANLDGSGGGGQLSTAGAPTNLPTGIAVDAAADKIYWANQGDGTIGFANLDGSGGGGQVPTGGATLDVLTGIALDRVTERIYWANYLGGAISYANLDGSGGGDLSTAGAPMDGPVGVAVDSAAGRIYWANYDGNTIAFANLDGSGGGGQLATTGATVANPYGMAIDPGANRIYWTNDDADSLFFANLDGSGGGGQLSTAGAPGNDYRYAALLKAPAGIGQPQVTGGGEVGQELGCSQGSWAPNLPGAQLYRAPRSFAIQWSRNGAEIGGATQTTFTPTEQGEYRCRVTATNDGGSGSQTSPARTVVSQPEPSTPAIEITAVERDRAKGTATLTVAANVGGVLWVAKTKKVKRSDSVDLTDAGTTELEVIPRNWAARTLRRKGRAMVNPRVRFGPAAGGALYRRREFNLRRDSAGPISQSTRAPSTAR
jgi:DNA-binding beta-propeller fold protein YncE